MWRQHRTREIAGYLYVPKKRYRIILDLFAPHASQVAKAAI